jgi:hypothetical protein
VSYPFHHLVSVKQLLTFNLAVAFSSSYLHTTAGGARLDNLNFQLHHIAAGSTYSWNATVPYLRICYVASGKVLVTIDEKEFCIGAHGMWRIRPGEKCVGTNLNYAEALVHVTTVRDDELKYRMPPSRKK